MSFEQGLSGLNVASKDLDAIGNNIANASTVGYKAGRAEFADVFGDRQFRIPVLHTSHNRIVLKAAQLRPESLDLLAAVLPEQ